jgi:hypothetical protein
MKFKFIQILVLVPALFVVERIGAQVTDAGFKTFREKFPTEKTYLHFDKGSYFKGEDVWFKAYLLSNIDLSESKNFYVDVFDTAGAIIQHLTYPVFESSVAGQFTIPATYKGKFIHLKAYSQLMLNDPALIYSKTIPVNNDNTTALAPNTRTFIRFFPEGGHFVSGFNNKLAFKATDEYGNAVSISGAVHSADGNVVDTVITTHDGMGTFYLEPAMGAKYYFRGKDDVQRDLVMDIPPAENLGVHLEVANRNEAVKFRIERLPQATDKSKLLIVAQLNGYMVFSAKANLTDKNAVSGTINTAKFLPGVLQITLMDSALRPLLERVVFVKNKNGISEVSMSVIEKNTAKRGKNVIEVEVPDSIAANMSISVTAAHLSSDKTENILSRLLLSGDMRGRINNPVYYFSENSTEVENALDLVMLTNGWRSYNVSDIANNKMASYKYGIDTSFLFIKGKINSGKKMNGGLFSYSLKKEKGNAKLIASQLDNNNEFKNSFVFFDSIKLIALDKNLNSDLTVQTNLLPAFSKKIKLEPIDFISAARSNAEVLLSPEEVQRLKLLKMSTTLEDVVVKTKQKTKEQLLDEAYTSGFFSGDARYKFDIQNEPTALSAPDMLQYLLYSIPGLIVSRQSDMEGHPVGGASPSEPVVTWRGESPTFYLDEQPLEQDFVIKTPMTQIAYIKVFPPPFNGGFSMAAASGEPLAQSGRGGAIAVYTKKAGYYSSQDVIATVLYGYSSTKQFYSPDYADAATQVAYDNRSTIYWNPWLLIDPKKSKKVKVEFYNGDIYSKLNVVIQGFTTDGKLVSISKKLE